MLPKGKIQFFKFGDLKVAIQYEDDMADSVCDRIDNTGASNFTKAVQAGTSQNQCGSDSASVWNGFVSKVSGNSNPSILMAHISVQSNKPKDNSNNEPCPSIGLHL